MSADGGFAECISGEKLYQQRARKALPLLVRQAQAREPTYYSDLAPRLGMTNPRNLNYVLGYIGRALEWLSEKPGWEKIPPIQCLVLSKQTGLPGEGMGWFKWTDDYHEWPRSEQQARVEIQLEQKVYPYPKWAEVLEALGLSESGKDVLSGPVSSRGGGESEQHRSLKTYVRDHPEVLQVSATAKVEEGEFLLPSGDRLDVLFRDGDEWIAAEVKSAISGELDIRRGMFQCVKYQAIIEAYQDTEHLPKSARTILVLEGEFPTRLVNIKQTLGIEVIDSIRPKSEK